MSLDPENKERGGVVDASEYLFEKIKFPINDTLKRLKFE